MKIKVALDKCRYTTKLIDSEARKLRIHLPQEENYYDIKTIADCVGEQGQAFLPATFKGMASKQENFEQCQLFGIDFDDEPDYEKIKRKLVEYHLPIVFSYDTFSSTPEHPKYRIILCHIVPITERWLADMILKMLKKMFPEADKHCFETARLDYYSGKNGVIIGTPHFPSYLYQLIAFSIGISEHGSLKNRKVSYKGYQFLMMAYKNISLQRIQFYLISSELEQAVGRSRLLRTDSSVYLFSNFPCNQATFCLDNYLKDADAQELDTDENYD